MAYKGQYIVENTKKYAGDPSNVIYRSLWERDVFKWLDRNPNVKKWSSEEIVIPYWYDVDKRYHRYYPDLKIVFKDRTVIVEIKPAKETVVPKKTGKTKKQYVTESMTYIKNMNKWEAATSYCKSRKWEFQIWTEDTLTSMGIMQKPLKKIPGKLKPLAPYRKRKK
jgi:23S rRNA-/tRNA-specific pseudouridylate synthase